MIARLEDVPTAADDPGWHVITHYFGLTAFGLNAYVAHEAGQQLVAEHDEQASGQEEAYLVTAGRMRFWLDGEEHDVPAGSLVVLKDPAVVRRGVACDAGTTLVAVGGPARERFESSWRSSHFEGVPRLGE